jgi:hypothetical protein
MHVPEKLDVRAEGFLDTYDVSKFEIGKHVSCPRLHRLQPTNRRVYKDLRWRDLRNRQE